MKSGGFRRIRDPRFCAKRQWKIKPGVFHASGLSLCLFNFPAAMLCTAQKAFAALPSLISAAGSLPSTLPLLQPPPRLLRQSLSPLGRNAELCGSCFRCFPVRMQNTGGNNKSLCGASAPALTSPFRRNPEIRFRCQPLLT